MARRLRARGGWVALLWLTIAPAAAPQEIGPRTAVGRIAGRVTEGGTIPVVATVRAEGTGARAFTDAEGRYLLLDVPAGLQVVQVEALGYGKLSKTVHVSAGALATLDFDFLQPEIVREIEEVEVRGERVIDVRSSSSWQMVTREEFERLPVDQVSQALGLKAGVVVQGGSLHVRGGRSGEVKYEIDGVEAYDPLFGRAPRLAWGSVGDVELLTGGFDAEHGNALSGKVSIRTNEGGERFGGALRWDTDRYGDPTKTFDRYDRVTGRMYGPAPIESLTFFASVEGAFSDTYLRSGRSRRTRTLWDFIQLGSRQFNQVNANLKLAYVVNPRHKLTLEAIHSRTIDTPYLHMWSRSGFVQVRRDTVRRDGQPDQVEERYGRWSHEPSDSTFIPVNLADHVPTDDDRFAQLKAVWTAHLGQHTQLSGRLSALRFRNLRTVGNKGPSEYWIESPQYWDGNTVLGSENNPFFATHGDFPAYSRSRSTTLLLKGDVFTSRWRSHAVKAGVEAQIHRVANLDLLMPNRIVDGLAGGLRSDFAGEHPEAAAYLQDRWEFEGLVMNAGVRYDMFSPGPQVPAHLLPGGRYKHQISPRLGFAFPISQRSALSFHYGRNSQSPPRLYLFEGRKFVTPAIREIREGPPGVRGNPDLRPETSISYQAALQHVFATDWWGQFAVFHKDIFGLVVARPIQDEFGNQATVYENGDYASARGFEASLIKVFRRGFGLELNYTFQIATGVASDPRHAQQFLEGGRLYLPISEQALDWDRRGTLSAQARVADPGRWDARLLLQYGSGFPFTPMPRDERRPDPARTNSGRLPATSSVSLVADRSWPVWGQDVSLFLSVRNLLNSRNVERLGFDIFPNPFVGQAGDEYVIYYTETGRAGGAYLQDRNGDGVLDWVPVHDPRVFLEPRSVRLGAQWNF